MATGPLEDIFIARHINTVSAGAVIAPWEVGQLDDATVDVYLALARRLAPMQRSVAAIEARKAEIRSQHPAYKYLRHQH